MTKYVVLSFDDGLLDFKKNALPILNKYGFKSTINIISGYSDKTIYTLLNYLPISDIVDLFDKGFEIANHTNSHIRSGSYQELYICNQKLNKWLSTNNVYGIAMPKYVEPNDDASMFIKKHNPPYVTYWHKESLVHNFFRRLFWKCKVVFNNDKQNAFIYKVCSFMYKKDKVKLFNRIEVGKDSDMKVIYEGLRHIRSKYCVTLCFHSITDDLKSCDYPKGALNVKQFDTLCSLIHGDNSFKVITQIEACRQN